MADRSRKNGSKANQTTHTDMVRRLESALGKSGMSKAEFARSVGVAPPQVTAWFKGDEQPSARMLIAIGNLPGIIRDDSIWFWKKAGLDIEMLRGYFAEELVTSAKPFSVELFPPEAVLRFATKEEAVSSVAAAQKSRSTICLMVPTGLPYFAFPEGDFVLVEPRGTDLDGLENSLVAVYLERMPERFELTPEVATLIHQKLTSVRQFNEADERLLRINSEINPELEALSRRQNEERWQRILATFDRPTVLFGRLRVQTADHRGETASWRDWQTRVALEITSQASGKIDAILPLSGWDRISADPQHPGIYERIGEAARVLGRVVGWIENSANPRKLEGRRNATKKK